MAHENIPLATSYPVINSPISLQSSWTRQGLLNLFMIYGIVILVNHSQGPFHYALSYAGVFEALGLPIKLEEGEAWEKLWQRYESGGDETSDGEQYLFKVMDEIDYLSMDPVDDEPKCTREEILHALTERFYAETLISLDLKADDGLNLIIQNAKRRALGEMD